MVKPAVEEDYHSIEELRDHAVDIIDQMHHSGKPVVLTVDGKADSVLLDVHLYESILLAGMIAPADKDIEAGRCRPAREFIQAFRRERKISG